MTAAPSQPAPVQITAVSGEPPNPKEAIRSRHAWYAYFAAYEPVSILVMQLLFPLLIDSLAVSASYTTTGGSGTMRRCTASDDLKHCRLPGIGCTPTTYPYFVLAASVLLQTIAFVSFGALADYGHFKGIILLWTGVVGGFVGCLCLLCCLVGSSWDKWAMTTLMVISVLFVVLQVVFGTASICYNAVLPLLTRDGGAEKTNDQSANMNEISLRGMMAGYSASLLELVLAAALLYVTKTLAQGKPWVTTLPIAASTLVWAVIGALTLRRMKPAHRPGLPLPPNQSLIVLSWRLAWTTCKSLRQLSTLRSYLLSYLIFSDGYGTVGVVAVLFARTEMRLEEWMIVVAVACLLVSCILGSWFYIKLDGGKRFSSVKMLMALCVLQALIPLYGMLGLISDLPIGFKQPWEAFMLACYYGFHIGACNSYARVAFAELLPPGREAEYFSLFAITDKGSSILGPLLFGVVASLKLDKRWGLLFLFVMLVGPLPVLYRVDVERGRREARQLVHGEQASERVMSEQEAS